METKLSIFCDKMIEAGWLAAAATMPLFFNAFSSRVFEPDKLTVLRVIVLVMVLAWLIKLVETTRTAGDLLTGARQVLRSNVLAIPVLVFAALYLFTTFTSVSPDVSFWGSYQRMEGTLVNLCYITLFFLTAQHLRTRQQFDRLITVILLTSLLVAIYGIIQHLGLDPLHWGGDVTARVTSTLGNAIFCAAYLIMTVPWTVIRLIDTGRPVWVRIRALRRGEPSEPQNRAILLFSAYLVLLIVQLLAILFTKSRGPWIGLGVGTILLVELLLVLGRRWRLTGAFTGLVLAAVAFTFVLNQPNSPLTSLRNSNVYLQRLGSMMDSNAGTNKVRALIWAGDSVGRGAIGLINADPWRKIVGWGPETMYVAYNPYYPPDLAHLEARNATPDRSHNDFLDFLVTMGVLGLTSYLLIVFVFFYYGLRFLWRATDTYQRLLAVGLLSAVTAHLAETFFGIAIAATRTHFWLYMAGLAYLVASQREKGPVLSTAKESVPVEARAARPERPAASQVRASSAARHREVNRTRRSPAVAANRKPARPAVGVGQPRTDTFSKYLPISLYLAVTAVMVPVLLLTSSGQEAAMKHEEALVILGFIWLLVGLWATTVFLDRPGSPRLSFRGGRALLYLPLLGVGAYVAIAVFLSVIIADVYFKSGQNFDDAGRFASSVPIYLKALSWQGNQDFYYLFLGRSYLELSKTAPDSGVESTISTVNDLFNRMLLAQPGAPTDLVLSSRLTRSDYLHASLVALQRAEQLNPLNTDNSANLGRLYRAWADMTNDPNKKQDLLSISLNYYQRATTLSPHAAHLFDEWGSAYQAKGLNDEAASKYQRSLDLDALYVPPYLHLADLETAGGQTDRAQALLERAVELIPSSPDVHSALATLYSQQGQLVEASNEYLKAVALNPQDLNSHENLAVVFDQLGMIDKAISETQIALRLAPTDQQAKLRSNLNELQQKKGK